MTKPPQALEELQTVVAQAILNRAAAATVASYFKSTESWPAESRFAVYQSTHAQNLSSALAQIYPVTQRVVGKECFRTFAVHYLKKHPSGDEDLNSYGSFFPELLSEICRKNASFSALPYLPQLAYLELYHHKSYYAAEASRFDSAAFAKLSPLQQDSCSFVLHPSLFLIASEYPLAEIWHENRRAVPDAELAEISLVQLKSNWYVIFRQELFPQIIAVEREVYDILNLISKGLPLNTLAHQTSDELRVNPITKIISNNWICGFSPG